MLEPQTIVLRSMIKIIPATPMRTDQYHSRVGVSFISLEQDLEGIIYTYSRI